MKFRVGDRVLCNNPTIKMDDLAGTIIRINGQHILVEYDSPSPQTGTKTGNWSTELYVRHDPKYITKLHKALS